MLSLPRVQYLVGKLRLCKLHEKAKKKKKSSSAGRVRNKAALSCMGGFTGVSAVRIHLQCRSHRKCRLNPGLGRCPGGGHSDSLQYCCLENPMDRGAWQATVHMVTKSQTWLKQLSTAVWTRKCQHRLIRELENDDYKCWVMVVVVVVRIADTLLNDHNELR